MWPPTEPQRDWRSEASVRRIADSARVTASEPEHGARTRIYQFCMDLGIERALVGA
jgi:hypothetical protein